MLGLSQDVLLRNENIQELLEYHEANPLKVNTVVAARTNSAVGSGFSNKEG